MPTGLIGGNKVTDELSREEVSSRLEEIFSSSLEGEELDKAVSSIPKRLDKFEGKWDGLIKGAEQKYGANEPTDEEAAEEEAAEEAVEEEAVEEEAVEEDATEGTKEGATSALLEVRRIATKRKEREQRQVGVIESRQAEGPASWRREEEQQQLALKTQRVMDACLASARWDGQKVAL